jgi:6-phosphogluconolactonase
LAPVRQTVDVEHPFFLALSPDRRFLYSIHAPGQFGGEKDEQIAAFELVGRTGELKLLNRQSARGTAACYLDVDATGKTVLVANYTTGSVAALPIAEDGSLGSRLFRAACRARASSSSGSRPPRPLLRHQPRQPLCLGRRPRDSIRCLVYQLDAESAGLTPAPQPFVRTLPGAGPRTSDVSILRAANVYVINELANSVTMFDYLRRIRDADRTPNGHRRCPRISTAPATVPT